MNVKFCLKTIGSIQRHYLESVLNGYMWTTRAI